jgi:hypothetical protein
MDWLGHEALSDAELLQWTRAIRISPAGILNVSSLSLVGACHKLFWLSSSLCFFVESSG